MTKNYLVRDEYKFVLDWELDDFLDSFAVEDSTCGVTRVDDDQGFGGLALFTGGLDWPFELFKVQLPTFFLVEVVWAHMTTVEADWSWVKRILRDRDHDWVVRGCDQCFKDEMDALGSAFSQENVINAGSRYVVFSTDVVGDCFSDWWDTQRMGVAACTDDLVEIFLCPFRSVRVDGWVTDKTGVEYARQDFPVESNWFLLELLRVADVAESYLVERVIYIKWIKYLLFQLGVGFAFKLRE